MKLRVTSELFETEFGYKYWFDCDGPTPILQMGGTSSQLTHVDLEVMARHLKAFGEQIKEVKR